MVVKVEVGVCADVDEVVGEHLSLSWVVKALPEQAMRILEAVLDKRTAALEASEDKRKSVWNEVSVHFAGIGDCGSWSGCTQSEAHQSLIALERLISRESGIVKGARAALSRP